MIWGIDQNYEGSTDVQKTTIINEKTQILLIFVCYIQVHIYITLYGDVVVHSKLPQQHASVAPCTQPYVLSLGQSCQNESRPGLGASPRSLSFPLHRVQRVAKENPKYPCLNESSGGGRRPIYRKSPTRYSWQKQNRNQLVFWHESTIVGDRL